MSRENTNMSWRWFQIWWLLILIVALLPQASAKEPQTPEEMYQYAVRQLDRGYYEKAVSVFEQIKTRYPFSKYAVLSELRVGDAHFKKGEYIEAVDAYRNFIKLHPRHPELDYVVYRIGLSQFKDAPKWVQRDQTSTRQMLATIAHFEERFPNSEYTDEVQTMRAEGRSRLAKGTFAIGRFYYKRGRYNTHGDEQRAAYNAALGRFEEVLDEYPDVTEVAVSAMYHIGVIYLLLGDPDQAAETVDRLRSRFPEAESTIEALEEKIPLATEPTSPGPETPIEQPSAGQAPESVPQWGEEPNTHGSQPVPDETGSGDDEPPPPPPRVQDDNFMPSLEPATPPDKTEGESMEEEPPPPPAPAATDDDFMPVLEPTPTPDVGHDNGPR